MSMMLIIFEIIRWQSGDDHDVDYHQNLKNNQVAIR
jgi:hypothetical protein